MSIFINYSSENTSSYGGGFTEEPPPPPVPEFVEWQLNQLDASIKAKETNKKFCFFLIKKIVEYVL